MAKRRLNAKKITETVARVYREINIRPRADVLKALRASLKIEESETGRKIIEQILENAKIAAKKKIPSCQDTGVATVFVRMGQDVSVTGGGLQEAIDEGVRRAQKEGYLRASMIRHPLDRVNTGDNTPAIVHVEIEKGDGFVMDILARGAGSENSSRLSMLSPSEGRQGVIETVVETVRRNGPNACPPLVVGIGIGGTMDSVAIAAKQAFLRKIDKASADPVCAELERQLLGRINALGIGPQGFGGRVTALGVLVEARPCHMAALPVCVSLMCHAFRHGRVEL